LYVVCSCKHRTRSLGYAGYVVNDLLHLDKSDDDFDSFAKPIPNANKVGNEVQAIVAFEELTAVDMGNESITVDAIADEVATNVTGNEVVDEVAADVTGNEVVDEVAADVIGNEVVDEVAVDVIADDSQNVAVVNVVYFKHNGFCLTNS
jgi:hypothetical protein